MQTVSFGNVAAMFIGRAIGGLVSTVGTIDHSKLG